MRKLFILVLIAFTMKEFGQTYTLEVESESELGYHGFDGGVIKEYFLTLRKVVLEGLGLKININCEDHFSPTGQSNSFASVESITVLY